MMDYGCLRGFHPWSIFNRSRKTSACLGWPKSPAWLGPYCSNMLRVVETWDYPTRSILAQVLKYFVCVPNCAPSRTPWAGRCGWQADTWAWGIRGCGAIRILNQNQPSSQSLQRGRLEHVMAPRGTFRLVPPLEQGEVNS